MRKGRRRFFFAYSLDGKKLYQTAYGVPWTDTYPETRTRLRSRTGSLCHQRIGRDRLLGYGRRQDRLESGRRQEVRAYDRKWGTSECPLVFDNKVIYTPGGNQTTMVALDAETGETVWKSEPLGEHSSYTSPLLVMNNGKIKIVGVTGKSVFGVNPETGKIEWTSVTGDGLRKIWRKDLNRSPHTRFMITAPFRL